MTPDRRRTRKQHIVVVDLAGNITNQTAANLFRVMGDLSAGPRPAGIVLRITSLGGSLGSAQAIVETLDAAADENELPIYVVVEQSAVSAAFYVAMAGQRVFATGAANLGGMGAVIRRYDADELLRKIGVGSLVLASGSEKTAHDTILTGGDGGSGSSVAALVEETLDQFATHVAARRSLAPAALDRLRDGRLLSGRQALDLGLVDATGGTHAALAAMIGALGLSAPEITYLGLQAPSGFLDQLVGRLPLAPVWRWLLKAGR